MAKIRSLRAVPVRVPLRTPLVTALGTIDASNYTILILTTDDGDTGLGEISLIWHGNGARLWRDVAEVLAPAVHGLDVFDRNSTMAAAAEAFTFGKHTLTLLAAFNMALLDVQGKIVGRSVIDLLGGATRERVPLSMSLSIASLEATINEARSYVEEGFRTLKVKGARDAAHTTEVVAALRREFGSALGIRVDLNMALATAKEALRAIRMLEPYDVLSVEQPLRPDGLAGMAYLRAHCAVPIMADESVWSPADAWRVVNAQAADILNTYVSEAGGIDAALRIATLCDLAGVGFSIGSMPELGIGTAAAAAVAFTAPRLDHPSDVCGFRYHAGDVVAHGLRIADGDLLPPTGPGLGCALDEEELQRFTTEG
jgi:L-alanine-DL-glutamate epimerase-like enolase superfamily enzyme